ncbi:MAG TPA: nucleoside-diphosphate kinase [Candidatus Saccharimonadales bacterium]|nr:nucleoside-diphosphate kinase [Candidatus Saccharimonadales bacterium]
MEQTLVILKPDVIERGIIGDIITRFERVGLKIVGLKMIVPEDERLAKHYPTDRREFIEGMGNKTLNNYKDLGIDPKAEFGHIDPYKIGLEIQKWLVDFMKSGPVIAVVLEGPHVIEVVRKIAGFTLPSQAQPGTIRGDYSFDSSALANSSKRTIHNLVHASGNMEEAEHEIPIWFEADELHKYETIHQKHMTP